MKLIFASFFLGIMTLFGVVKIIRVQPAQPAASLDWYTQVVDQFGSYQYGPNSSHSLRLDSSGQPHIAYAARGHLFHAWNDGTLWHIETVDGNAGSPALALDHADKPHIAYNSNGSIKYAYWAGGIWNIQSVDNEVTGEASLALDAAGRPRLSYYTNNDIAQPSGYAFAVKYAAWVNNAWHIQTIEQGINANSNVTVLGTSLALDSSGNPHISYALSYLPSTYASCDHWCVKYTHWTGNAWNTQIIEQNDTIPPTVDSVWAPDLVLDGADHPHLIYGETIGIFHLADVGYARWTGSNWETSDPFNLPYPGQSGLASLALDSNDNPYFSYDSYYGGIQFAHFNGYTWDLWELVADDSADITSLALDAQNGAHIVYFSQSGTLKYAQKLPSLVLTKEAFPKDDVTVGDTVTYKLVFSGPAGHSIQVLDPLPENVVYVPGSVTPPALYSPTIQAILWQGILPTNTVPAISFQVTLTGTINLSSTEPVIINTAWLTDTAYDKHTKAFAIINGLETYFPIIMH